MRHRALALLCLSFAGAAFASMPRAQAADDAAALLAKHAAYVGWRGGDGSLTSLRETGEVTRDGKVLSHMSSLQVGPVYREDVDRANGSYQFGFTGKVFWTSNVNGFTIPVRGDAVKYVVTDDQLGDEELTSLPGTVHGTATIDGVKTTIVRVEPPAGFPVDLYIDPTSGAFVRYIIDPDGRYRSVTNDITYSDVGNGKRVIGSWRNGDSRAIHRYTQIEANVAISNADLHPPEGTARWTFGAPTQTVPIFVTDKRIFIDAVVNGHRGHFGIDTGSSGIAFTDSFARLAGAMRSGSERISGIGGSARANRYQIDTLAIGPHTLHDVIVNSGLDESAFRSEQIDGILGFDLFGGAIVDLDLDAQTARILDPKAYVPDRSQGWMLELDLSGGLPHVPVTLDGRVPVNALLDTGDPFHVLVNPELVAHEHLSFFSAPDSLGSNMMMSGVNGREHVQCGQLGSLELGSIAYRPVPACQSTSIGEHTVLVGFDFIKNFNLTLDYPDGELLLTPRKGH